MSDHKQLFREAKAAELSDDMKNAAVLYEKLLKEDSSNEQILHRLMIIYRKLRSYKKEISIINKAIKLQQQYYKPSSMRKGIIADISKKLNLSTGLMNKNGESIMPDSISRLEKRKEIVLKKIN